MEEDATERDIREALNLESGAERERDRAKIHALAAIARELYRANNRSERGAGSAADVTQHF